MTGHSIPDDIERWEKKGLREDIDTDAEHVHDIYVWHNFAIEHETYDCEGIRGSKGHWNPYVLVDGRPLKLDKCYFDSFDEAVGFLKGALKDKALTDSGSKDKEEEDDCGIPEHPSSENVAKKSMVSMKARMARMAGEPGWREMWQAEIDEMEKAKRKKPVQSKAGPADESNATSPAPVDEPKEQEIKDTGTALEGNGGAEPKTPESDSSRDFFSHIPRDRDKLMEYTDSLLGSVDVHKPEPFDDEAADAPAKNTSGLPKAAPAEFSDVIAGSKGNKELAGNMLNTYWVWKQMPDDKSKSNLGVINRIGNVYNRIVPEGNIDKDYQDLVARLNSSSDYTRPVPGAAVYENPMGIGDSGRNLDVAPYERMNKEKDKNKIAEGIFGRLDRDELNLASLTDEDKQQLFEVYGDLIKVDDAQRTNPNRGKTKAYRYRTMLEDRWDKAGLGSLGHAYQDWLKQGHVSRIDATDAEGNALTDDVTDITERPGGDRVFPSSGDGLRVEVPRVDGQGNTILQPTGAESQWGRMLNSNPTDNSIGGHNRGHSYQSGKPYNSEHIMDEGTLNMIGQPEKGMQPANVSFNGQYRTISLPSKRLQRAIFENPRNLLKMVTSYKQKTGAKNSDEGIRGTRASPYSHEGEATLDDIMNMSPNMLNSILLSEFKVRDDMTGELRNIRPDIDGAPVNLIGGINYNEPLFKTSEKGKVYLNPKALQFVTTDADERHPSKYLPRSTDGIYGINIDGVPIAQGVVPYNEMTPNMKKKQAQPSKDLILDLLAQNTNRLNEPVFVDDSNEDAEDNEINRMIAERVGGSRSYDNATLMEALDPYMEGSRNLIQNGLPVEKMDPAMRADYERAVLNAALYAWATDIKRAKRNREYNDEVEDILMSYFRNAPMRDSYALMDEFPYLKRAAGMSPSDRADFYERLENEQALKDRTYSGDPLKTIRAHRGKEAGVLGTVDKYGNKNDLPYYDDSGSGSSGVTSETASAMRNFHNRVHGEGAPNPRTTIEDAARIREIHELNKMRQNNKSISMRDRIRYFDPTFDTMDKSEGGKEMEEDAMPSRRGDSEPRKMAYRTVTMGEGKDPIPMTVVDAKTGKVLFRLD